MGVGAGENAISIIGQKGLQSGAGSFAKGSYRSCKICRKQSFKCKTTSSMMYNNPILDFSKYSCSCRY
jgi:hypothetical protein